MKLYLSKLIYFQFLLLTCDRGVVSSSTGADSGSECESSSFLLPGSSCRVVIRNPSLPLAGDAAITYTITTCTYVKYALRQLYKVVSRIKSWLELELYKSLCV